MTLRANTIEFNGEKAVINSYSLAPELDASMNNQFAKWSAAYPNATVKNETLPYNKIVALVAAGHEAAGNLGNHAYNIGQKSKG